MHACVASAILAPLRCKEAREWEHPLAPQVRSLKSERKQRRKLPNLVEERLAIPATDAETAGELDSGAPSKIHGAPLIISGLAAAQTGDCHGRAHLQRRPAEPATTATA
jgi:hypothetical protein